ncbi:branched-chain amino acid ABC transporter permease [Pseudohalocynthiibacter aestuariivivens]|uniref:Branched-chain amino acid ABC transporter permease n=1 Tax=Roseovarius pelagicus TaxID=2980108 RepID=A0ABY6D7I9_9RHOB|nr:MULTISPECIES: branched-chain amino acid ABC transporter permease [Rhodobacterales]QIE45968.1 branched-chain amino acid ABC transporter permease [Pseudohalocynthiibacter aestuariivivens]QIE45982.1 branched-chain amino acid ABC transporter permease [Pseudohalocynthiibacter aestuariivivens]UXX82043.1 branched-chain amino acid ABC transporter permease [Roseovarius pelagicus]UXX82058.1 branched-chain amino acid ABC transporter permease [Roseovarius pelagicus]
MDVFLQVVVNGLMLGGLFAITSVGLTLIFGIVKVVNFAHGEFLMIGMYAAFLVTTQLGVHPYAAVVAVTPLLFVLGMMTQKFLIEPLMSARNHDIQIFATVGLSTALINLALLLFGADIASTPSYGLRNSIEIGSIRLLTGQVVMFIVAVVLVIGLHFFLQHTQAGRGIRAVAQNRAAAQLMGINVSRVYMITFGLGAACVGVAATLVAPLYPTSPGIGTYFVLTAFVVVVLGGLGSIGGAFLGAMIIGLIDSLSGFYIGSDMREVAVFGVFLLILILRPQGLFGGRQTLSHVS